MIKTDKTPFFDGSDGLFFNESSTTSQLFLIMKECITEDAIVQGHLGLTFTSNLSWRGHILKIHQRVSSKLNILKPMQLIISIARSSLKYADVVHEGRSESCLILFARKLAN